MKNRLVLVEGFAMGTLSKEELDYIDEFPVLKKAAMVRKYEINMGKTINKKIKKKGVK